MNSFFRSMLFACLLGASYAGHADSTWFNKQYSIAGDWSIETTDAGRFFVLADNFKTKAGPDLKLLLIKKPISSVGNKDALHEDRLLIAALKSTSGAQRYQIPDGVDLADYQSLVIHCQQYSVVWGGIELP